MEAMEPISIEEAFRQQMAMLGVTNFSWWSLLAALIFGIAGFYVLRGGWRVRRLHANAAKGAMATGIALMVYPMIITGPYSDWIIGFALTGLGYYLVNFARRKPSPPADGR